jgi:hypothetical protein
VTGSTSPRSLCRCVFIGGIQEQQWSVSHCLDECATGLHCPPQPHTQLAEAATNLRAVLLLPAAAALSSAQAISQHCCPATKARLRLVCSAWHQALATQFSALYLGPGNPAGELASTDRTSQQQQQQQQQQHLLAWVLGDSLHSALPAVSALQLVASSSREYEDTFTQVGTPGSCVVHSLLLCRV